MGSVKRVLVVDDSSFMRSVISHLLEQDPELRVVGTARNGLEAIRRARELRPDVITMDLEMPEMDGLSALQVIMRENPTPVVVLTAAERGDADLMVKALAMGAVDFITKPSGPVSVDLAKAKEEIIARVRAAADAEVTHTKGTAVTTLDHLPPLRRAGSPPLAVGVAASTGGPRALEVLLAALPRTLAASVFIVQHMPPGLTSSFARRLSWMTSLEVVEAMDGTAPRFGVAYVAPGDYHMLVERGDDGRAIRLSHGEKVNSVRPSADILFESLVSAYGRDTVGVVLTGMGSDGAEGLLAIRRSGGTTVVESPETCVVYGMPRSAIALGAAERVLRLEEIGPAILQDVGVLG
jgi:two-component system chemotaxis response regulator CheB